MGTTWCTCAHTASGSSALALVACHILRLLGEGKSTAGIAGELGLVPAKIVSTATVCGDFWA
jgi:hypothetical protein